MFLRYRHASNLGRKNVNGKHPTQALMVLLFYRTDFRELNQCSDAKSKLPTTVNHNPIGKQCKHGSWTTSELRKQLLYNFSLLIPCSDSDFHAEESQNFPPASNDRCCCVALRETLYCFLDLLLLLCCLCCKTSTGG